MQEIKQKNYILFFFVDYSQNLPYKFAYMKKR